MKVNLIRTFVLCVGCLVAGPVTPGNAQATDWYPSAWGADDPSGSARRG